MSEWVYTTFPTVVDMASEFCRHRCCECIRRPEMSKVWIQSMLFGRILARKCRYKSRALSAHVDARQDAAADLNLIGLRSYTTWASETFFLLNVGSMGTRSRSMVITVAWLLITGGPAHHACITKLHTSIIRHRFISILFKAFILSNYNYDFKFPGISIDLMNMAGVNLPYPRPYSRSI